MSSDPKPNQSFGSFNRQGTEVQANTDRAIFPDFFEMQGWMVYIFFEEIEVLLGQFLNRLRDGAIAVPKTG
jgi:hypothetical protein